jgi:hypothetical protein
MKRSSLLPFFAIFTLSVLMACPNEPSKTLEQHAGLDAKVGSHEDWCDEHAVPESQCTQCNRELVAAFKATGDWCDEHGLPESQCKKCNPAIVITRPPKSPETK